MLTRFYKSTTAALSADEERLWSVVRANSLDFDAWTALIEETEKVAEVYHIERFHVKLSVLLLLFCGCWLRDVLIVVVYYIYHIFL